jgi:glycosyltransferase involved in cell wall biosynthesis
VQRICFIKGFRLRVVLISQQVSPGLVIFRKTFIEHLVSLGHQVYAFAVDYTPDTRKQVEAMGAVPVTYSLDKAGFNPLADVRDTWRLYLQLRRLEPDGVLSFFVKPSLYGSIAGRLSGADRCVAMLEGLGFIYTETPEGVSFKKKCLQSVHGVLASLAYSFSDKVVFLNHDDPEDLGKTAFISRQKIEVFGPIGLDLSEFPFSKMPAPLPFRFLFVGRLLKEKGIYDFLAAARLLKSDYPHVEFLVVGDLDPGNPSSLTQLDVDALKKEGVVRFEGFAKNVQEWLCCSHVLVLPSYREGFPRVVQEAMSMGRAIVTTQVPGCREAVMDGHNGFIVPPWSPETLASKMRFLVDHFAITQQMGERSYSIARNRFDAVQTNRQLARIVLGDGFANLVRAKDSN